MEESPPPRRNLLTGQQLTVLVIVLLLLLLPLGLLGFFLVDQLHPEQSGGTLPSQALEESIERAAAEAFPIDTDLSTEIRVSESVVTSVGWVRNLTRAFGGEVIFWDSEDGIGRVVVRIPESRAEAFEAAVRAGKPQAFETPPDPLEPLLTFEVFVGE